MANRLAEQTSTYLLSHAKDPVDWYPWGPEAFARARELDQPVLISIGYDSCHWCHVMQRESFRDEVTAATLNEQFVCIKVDRELRPDVDHFYMTYTTLATGQGGWPMTVFTTSDGTPFFAGTYFPKTARQGMISFGELLKSVRSAYAEDPEETRRVGIEAVASVSQVIRPQPLRPIEESLVSSAAKETFTREDAENGGIGGAPKFPQAPLAGFLLAYAESTGSETALAMARRWTYSMLRSGTYDQVGGGLFRYSTDAGWLVPHFEKMLYDNALLLSTIAMLYRIEPAEELAHYARRTAAFLDRDLAASDGGYYSSLDAETEGVEGSTYVWSWDELAAVLDEDELALASAALGATEQGNWEGKNILTLREGHPERPAALGDLLSKLLEARAQRPQPKLITNLLTDWNALAAIGLIEAGVAIGDEVLVAQGMRTVDWIRENAMRDGRVSHAPQDPSAADVDLIEDYSATILALLAAADAAASGMTDETQVNELALRQEASELLETALDRFEDGSVIYMTAEETDLPLRPISYDDAPTPSGAAMLAEAYVRLRPDDAAGLDRLLVPASGIVIRASYMAGTWLQVMTQALSR